MTVMIKKLLSLFLTFFKIGLFTFGGGYAMIAIIENEFCVRRPYMTQDELADLVAVAETTPGPIAINCATYVGVRRAGFAGAVAATLGVVLPSFIVIILIAGALAPYWDLPLVNRAFKGISVAVALVILRAGINMFRKAEKRPLPLLMTAVSTLLLLAGNFFSFHISSIYMIIAGGLIGFLSRPAPPSDRKEDES